MTAKQKLLAFVQGMSDDAGMGEVLYKLDLFVNVQAGLAEAAPGKGTQDDVLMKSPQEQLEMPRDLGEGRMTTSRELKTKSKILDVITRMPEDGTVDDALYRLNVLKAVTEGIEAAEQGRVYDHDEVFDALLKDDAKHASKVDGTSKPGFGRTKESNRGERPQRRPRVPQKAKSVRR